MARLSYDNSGVVRQGNVRHVCVAVSRDGDYRMETIELCGHWITAKTQRLHGKMPKQEFRQLTELGERLTSEICRGIIPEHGCERCWAFCDEGEKSLVSIQWVFPPKPIMTP
jgi:hypothetical protein